jgi:hypothetical protein
MARHCPKSPEKKPGQDVIFCLVCKVYWGFPAIDLLVNILPSKQFAKLRFVRAGQREWCSGANQNHYR